MDLLLHAIAEPRRRRILQLIQAKELPAGQIASHFDVTRSAVSQHLTVLKAAGLVHERREGTRRLYRARPEGLAELRAFLEEFWGERLQLLKEAAEAEERRSQMAQSSQSDAVEVEVRIAARPETIFPFFTDPAKMTRWKGVTADLDARPGGIYRVNITGRDIAQGKYVEVVPHSRVVFTWGWEGEGNPVPPGSSTVDVTLTPDGDETVVRLRHYDLPADQRDGHREGWQHYMERLAVAAAGGDPGPDPWASPS